MVVTLLGAALLCTAAAFILAVMVFVGYFGQKLETRLARKKTNALANPSPVKLMYKSLKEKTCFKIVFK